MDSTGHALAAFSFIALILLLPPFLYHARNKNIPACSLIFWLCFRNLITFINAIIWSQEDFYTVSNGKGYCDVVVRIDSGGSAGELSAITCLIFNLYMIMSTKSHKFIDNNSTRKIILNIFMCWTLPIIIMGTSVAVQTNRYVMLRYHGCALEYDNSYWYIFLVSMWPPAAAVVGLIFAVLTAAIIFQKRRDIKDIVRCSNSGLNIRRFARLLIFSLLIIFVMTPFAFFNFITSVNDLRAHDAGWTIERSPEWSKIVAYDAPKSGLATNIIGICLSICTFMLFGLGSDALTLYTDIIAMFGFKNLKRKNSEEFTISSSFTTTKQNTRATLESATTAAISEKKDREIVKVCSMGSNSLGSTLSDISPDELEMANLDDDDIDRILRGDLESDPQFQFKFN